MSEWRKGTDPKTALTYYFNKKTKLSQWEKPADFDDSVKAAPPTPVAVPDIDNPAKWKEARDAATGLPYWFNKAAGQSTYTKPACLSATSTAPASPALSEEAVRAAWKVGKDPASGTQFWFNKLTKESRWDDPFKVVPLETRSRSPSTRITPKQIERVEPSVEEPPPPPPDDNSEIDKLKADLKAATDSKHALERQVAEKSSLLEQRTRAHETLLARQSEWDSEKQQLLKFQSEQQLEIQRLTEAARAEPITLDKVHAELLAKLSTLEKQNLQVLLALKTSPPKASQTLRSL